MRWRLPVSHRKRESTTGGGDLIAESQAALDVAVAPETRPALVFSRGRCQPLGASATPDGFNFAVFSRHAQRIDLVLYADEHGGPIAEIALDPRAHRTGDVWHIAVSGLGSECYYGYRVHGHFSPTRGRRFDPTRVLVDPYARDLGGGRVWGRDGHRRVEGPCHRRSRAFATEPFAWEDDAPLCTPLSRSVIYEMHVRGFTRDPSSGVAFPGTFLGLCEKIPYLQQLGVTAVQLMPVLDFAEAEPHRSSPETGKRLLNYWGYNPISFFALKASYCANPEQPVREFQEMVKQLHRAGIEVILDVVYNHTCEGNELGTALSLRGLDNVVYYLLDEAGRYYNYTGCGNSLNCSHPVVRELVLDSLAYLVDELHVDGFRFDLASILGRGEKGEILNHPPLLEHIARHPVLSRAKLIAEPWDTAAWQLGRFPSFGHWQELNSLFRDDARRFLRGEAHAVGNVAKRICGSRDVYGDGPPHYSPSINFVTSHDGFTLCDLVSYTHKRNLMNGEENRDGWTNDLSYNCGHEGPTDDAEVNATRQRQMRNFMLLLLTSHGTPLILQGDELGRTQQGNNNAYCQDNEISWLDWKLVESNAGLLRFVRMLIALRRRRFALAHDEFCKRLVWHGPKLHRPDWSGESRCLAFQIRGRGSEPELQVLFNPYWERRRFDLPPLGSSRRWRRLVDTNLSPPDDIVEEDEAVSLSPGDHYVCMPRSAVVLVA